VGGPLGPFGRRSLRGEDDWFVSKDRVRGKGGSLLYRSNHARELQAVPEGFLTTVWWTVLLPWQMSS
jgi:hypothetical protein